MLGHFPDKGMFLAELCMQLERAKFNILKRNCFILCRETMDWAHRSG